MTFLVFKQNMHLHSTFCFFGFPADDVCPSPLLSQIVLFLSSALPCSDCQNALFSDCRSCFFARYVCSLHDLILVMRFLPTWSFCIGLSTQIGHISAMGETPSSRRSSVQMIAVGFQLSSPPRPVTDLIAGHLVAPSCRAISLFLPLPPPSCFSSFS